MNLVGMKPLDYQVTIGQVWDALDEDGNVKPEHIRGDIHELFRKLEDAQHA